MQTTGQDTAEKAIRIIFPQFTVKLLLFKYKHKCRTLCSTVRGLNNDNLGTAVQLKKEKLKPSSITITNLVVLR